MGRLVVNHAAASLQHRLDLYKQASGANHAVQRTLNSVSTRSVVRVNGFQMMIKLLPSGHTASWSPDGSHYGIWWEARSKGSSGNTRMAR